MSGKVTLALTVCSLLLGACRAQVRADLPAVEPANMKPEDLSAGWSQVKTDGAIKYREAIKGGRRSLSVPAWWDRSSLRPPENTVYVLEVRYKDTATVPVIAYSYGALGRWPSEVHRFGGAGDGKWKTARVAAGWDQIIRHGGKVTFGFLANADLPIASVKIRKASKADELRHNAETRAWVATVQADKRRATPIRVEPRKFLPGRKLPPVVAFAWPALVPILPNAQPKGEQVGATIKVRMCLNEMEGGGFGVYANGVDLTNVRYEVSDLLGPGGKLVADVIPRTAEYALVQRGRGRLKWYPQRLWPAYPVDIPAGRSHWFLFNLRTYRGRTVAGVYKGKVTITADQGKAELPVEVKVLPVDLLTMDEAGLFMGGCVTGLVPVHDFEFATAYNQNGTNLWFSGVHPTATIKDNRLHLDFTILDEWMAAAKKRGLKGFVWFLGGNPYGFPRTMTIFREMAAIDTRDGNKPLSKVQWMRKQSSKEFRDRPMKRDRELVVEWCRQVQAHALAKQWPEVILTPFDEPAKWVQGPYRKDSKADYIIGAGPWIKTYFKDACAALREGAPMLRIYGSIHHIDRSGKKEGLVFLYDIDVFCTNAIHEDQTIGQKVKAAGKEFWQYSGCNDQAPAHRGRFTFGWYFAAYDSRGSLIWAYNAMRRFDTSEGRNWGYGWYTPFGTVQTPFLIGVREGWDDRRWIALCKKTVPNAEKLLKPIFKQAIALRSRRGRDTVADFYAEIARYEKMDQWRNRVIEAILKR